MIPCFSEEHIENPHIIKPHVSMTSRSLPVATVINKLVTCYDAGTFTITHYMVELRSLVTCRGAESYQGCNPGQFSRGPLHLEGPLKKNMVFGPYFYQFSKIFACGGPQYVTQNRPIVLKLFFLLGFL